MFTQVFLMMRDPRQPYQYESSPSMYTYINPSWYTISFSYTLGNSERLLTFPFLRSTWNNFEEAAFFPSRREQRTTHEQRIEGCRSKKKKGLLTQKLTQLMSSSRAWLLSRIAHKRGRMEQKRGRWGSVPTRLPTLLALFQSQAGPLSPRGVNDAGHYVRVRHSHEALIDFLSRGCFDLLAMDNQNKGSDVSLLHLKAASKRKK